jgi:hypothetical protein
MTHIDRLSAAVLAISFALLPQAAWAECQAWELPAKFAVKQDNGYNVTFDVNVTNGKITGSAHYYEGANLRRVDGKVDGDFYGASFRIDVWWQTKAYGHYEGYIESDGHLKGVTKDLQNPTGANPEVYFRSPQTLRCKVAETPAPSPASPPSSGPWAAIAVDGNGHWGYAVGQPSPDVAKTAALQGCGGGACKILDALQARCIAYAESRAGGYWYFGLFGPDARSVENNAMSACWKAAPPNSCALVKAVCG